MTAEEYMKQRETYIMTSKQETLDKIDSLIEYLEDKVHSEDITDELDDALHRSYDALSNLYATIKLDR